MCKSSPHLDYGCNAVKIGDLHPYGGKRHSTDDETYNITIRNVYAEGINAIKLTGGMKNVLFQGIECAKGTKMFQDDRGKEQCDNGTVYTKDKKW